MGGMKLVVKQNGLPLQALTPHDIVEVLVEAEEDASYEEIDIVSAFDDSGDEMEDDADIEFEKI